MYVNFAAIIAFIAVAVGADPNPIVSAPLSLSYNAGDKMLIEWDKASTGTVNVDLVSDKSDVLPYPMTIASGLLAENGKFEWTIPNTLKSANGYRVRVWGTHQPSANDEEGQSKSFKLLNTDPAAVNTFTVTSPNNNTPCNVGSDCQITWDFNTNSVYPAMVDIGLYRVGSAFPIEHIATVDSSSKSFTWKVPANSQLLTEDMYISVSGQGIPLAGPGMSNDMGGNSKSFRFAPEKSQVFEKQSVDENENKEKSAEETNESKDEKDNEDEKDEEKSQTAAVANSAFSLSSSGSLIMAIVAAVVLFG